MWGAVILARNQEDVRALEILMEKHAELLGQIFLMQQWKTLLKLQQNIKMNLTKKKEIC